jgi:uncharacterized protein with HEPN domain
MLLPRNDCLWFVLYPLRGNNMTRMQDKIVYDLFSIHCEVITWQGCRTRLLIVCSGNGYRTNHKQSCPASLSCYYLGVMDTEQIINNLFLHPDAGQDCLWFVLYPLRRGNNMTRMQDKIVYDLFCIHYAEVITWQGCRTRLLITEQIINNLVLHPCHVITSA